MHIRDLLLDAFGRIDEEVRRTLEGLDKDQLSFRPNEQSDSIA